MWLRVYILYMKCHEMLKKLPRESSVCWAAAVVAKRRNDLYL